MRLDHATWPEVDTYLQRSRGIIVPAGSTEQHGPMGLIGTDALCAETIAGAAADSVDAFVAPTLAYTPAPFNMAFPGTISVSEESFESLVADIVDALLQQGFESVYFLNGHGANLQPLRRVFSRFPGAALRLRSWWDFESVNDLRRRYYGEWEGMHATPSEIAITQVRHRVVEPGAADEPPRKLSRDYIDAHSGDRHGAPEQHRQQFPDGRVGSHSALATPDQGAAILEAAISAVASDYSQFLARAE